MNEWYSLYEEGRLVMLEQLMQDYYLSLRLNHNETMGECIKRIGANYGVDTSDSCLKDQKDYFERANKYSTTLSIYAK